MRRATLARGAAGASSRAARAAVLAEPGRFELREVDSPRPGPRDLVVRLEGCGVCGSNLGPWAGAPWFEYPFPPGAPGHEGWGVVEEVGVGVRDFEPGDRVATLSDRAYADRIVAPAATAVRLPEALSDRPFPGEPLGCAVNVFERSRIRPEHTVAVVGVGFLGALVMQLASAAGARVIGLSRRGYALEVARSCGARLRIDVSDADAAVAAVEEATGGALCDVVIEATGKQAPLDLASRLTRERGRLVIAGYHQDGPRRVDMQLWNWRGLDVINAHERDSGRYLDGIRAAIDATLAGRLDPDPLITHEFPLDELGRALDATRVRPDGFLKAVVRP